MLTRSPGSSAPPGTRRAQHRTRHICLVAGTRGGTRQLRLRRLLRSAGGRALCSWLLSSAETSALHLISPSFSWAAQLGQAGARSHGSSLRMLPARPGSPAWCGGNPMHGSFQAGGSNQGSQVAWGEGELQGHLAVPRKGGTVPRCPQLAGELAR